MRLLHWHTYIYIGLLTILGLNASAAEVVINGSAEDFVGKRITLIGYADHFSGLTEVLASSVVSDNGEFSLNTDIERVRYAQLRCDRIAATLYLQPGAHYDTDFVMPAAGVPRAFAATARTEIYFNDLDEQDINARIIALNLEYERFFTERYDQLNQLMTNAPNGPATEQEGQEPKGRKSRVQIFDEISSLLSLHLDSLYPAPTDLFFDEYLNAVKAEMALKGKKTRTQLYADHLAGRPFMIHHPEQAKLYQEFFSDYFSYRSNSLGTTLGGDEKTADRLGADYLLSLVESDELLTDKGQSEIVLVHALSEQMRSKNADHLAIDSLLGALAINGVGASAQIAENAQLMLRRGRKGFAAPAVALSAVDGTVVDPLSTDKALLLHFWTTSSSMSAAETPQLAQLAERYGEHVELVNICLDEDRSLFERYMLTHPEMAGTSLYGGHDPLMAERYGVYAVPTYQIIDAQDRYLYVNAPKPSEGLEDIVFMLSKQAQQNSNWTPGEKRNGP